MSSSALVPWHALQQQPHQHAPQRDALFAAVCALCVAACAIALYAVRSQEDSVRRLRGVWGAYVAFLRDGEQASMYESLVELTGASTFTLGDDIALAAQEVGRGVAAVAFHPGVAWRVTAWDLPSREQLAGALGMAECRGVLHNAAAGATGDAVYVRRVRAGQQQPSDPEPPPVPGACATEPSPRSMRGRWRGDA